MQTSEKQKICLEGKGRRVNGGPWGSRSASREESGEDLAAPWGVSSPISKCLHSTPRNAGHQAAKLLF